MLRALGACLAILVACSGDDSHKQSTLHPNTVTPPAPADAAVAVAPVDATPIDQLPPAPLTEDMAQPYWKSGDELDGAQQFALEKWQPAEQAFTLALGGTKDPERQARIRLMIGLCDEQLKVWDKALEHLVAAHNALPLLADYTGYHAANAAYFAKKPAIVKDLASQIAPDSIVGYDAEMLVGDVLRDEGDWQKVLDHYTGYLTRRPNGPRRSEARFHVAEAMEHLKQPAADIAQRYRQIGIDDPLIVWATRAHDRMVEVAKAAKLDVAKLEMLNAADHITQGMVLFDNQRNPESEAAFDAALGDPKISEGDKCIAAYHKAQSRFKARDRKGAAPMFDEAVTACKAAKNADLEIKSDYQAGRSYSFFGEHDTAIKRYQAAQTIDPKHSYADDALLREGEEWTSLGDEKKVEEVLSALPTKFPDGDNLAEAMWRLGWHAWRAQKYDDAIKWWKKQIELVPRDDNYYGEGQAQYWLGRAYAAKKQPKDAIAAWKASVQIAPAAYYALLSLNRIREAEPKTYEALTKELAADPKGYDAKQPAFTFKPRPEWGAPGFLRAMDLMRMGLGVPAERELKKVGLAAPSDKKRVDDPDRIEKLWAIAYLYDKAGRHATSIWPTRWHILDYRTQWPVGANRARWLIAYPKAYWELLSRHAAMNKVPVDMQIAIVREESGFDPLDESYANAIGLTQMIPPTAKDFSKGTGIDPTRENLRDPEKNVTIGGRFLGSLYKTWDGFTLLVPPSYNAGPTGVKRMLKVRGTWDADEFVEGIVDDQARNYTKRVLGTFFTYNWLYDKTVPAIPNVIPKALLPKK